MFLGLRLVAAVSSWRISSFGINAVCASWSYPRYPKWIKYINTSSIYSFYICKPVTRIQDHVALQQIVVYIITWSRVVYKKSSRNRLYFPVSDCFLYDANSWTQLTFAWLKQLSAFYIFSGNFSLIPQINDTLQPLLYSKRLGMFQTAVIADHCIKFIARLKASHLSKESSAALGCHIKCFFNGQWL